MRKVFVHVGAPKTGTSLIQDLMRANAPTLAEHGVLYPDGADQHFLAALDLLEKPWGGLEGRARGCWAAMAERVNSWDGTAIISHEILASATKEQAGKALSDLDGEVHVVLSQRDLGRQIPAEWQELMKHRRQISYADFLTDLRREVPQTEPATWFRSVQCWPDVLERWAPTLPADRVHLVTVPAAGTASDLLLGRFCEVLELDPAWLTEHSERTNPGLGTAEAATICELNRRLHADRLPPRHYREFVREVLAHRTLAHRRDADRLRLPPDLSQWADDLTDAWLARTSERGVSVVGALDELRPGPAATDFQDPGSVPVEARLGVTETALDAMLIEAARLRDELSHLQDELSHLQEESRKHHEMLQERIDELEWLIEHPMMVRRQKFVAAAADHRVYAALLRAYRWVFRRGRT